LNEGQATSIRINQLSSILEILTNSKAIANIMRSIRWEAPRNECQERLQETRRVNAFRL